MTEIKDFIAIDEEKYRGIEKLAQLHLAFHQWIGNEEEPDQHCHL